MADYFDDSFKLKVHSPALEIVHDGLAAENLVQGMLQLYICGLS